MTKEVQHEELKPCPFCGSEARFVKCNDPDHSRVMCSKGGKCTASPDEIDPYGYATKEIAAEAWNTRVETGQAKPAEQPHDFPMGAIENGKAFIERLEANYRFEDDGRPLARNAEWDELKRCFDYMADYLLRHPAQQPPCPDARVESGAVKVAGAV
jgi:Lar family restriction alleviation protein